MGKPKRRVRPSVKSSVNRDFDTLFIRCLYKAVSRMDEEPYHADARGKPHPPRLVIMCLVLKIVFCKTYEEIEAFVKNNAQLKRLFRTKRMPTHSVIHTAMEKVSAKYIRRLMKITLYRARIKNGFKNMVAVPDSTGFRLKTSSVWYDIRIKRMNKRRDCLKLHVLADVWSGQILSVVVTDYKANDCPVFEELIGAAKGTFARVPGDSAYAGRKNCTLVAMRGGKPYFMPKKNCKAKSRGHPAWKIMVRAHTENEEAWLKEYHIRSFVEAVFSSMKRRFGSVVSSIKGWNRRRELLLKVLCYNIKELLYCLRADEIGVSKWVACK